jgi:hypothetical protein
LELNKRLNNKNKELLGQIEEKNMLIAELQRSIGEEKSEGQKNRLESSLKMEEKRQLEAQLAALNEENDKLYEEFKRVNMKYEEELEAIENHNGERMNELMKEI